ncbi:MAG: c-type cytochrome domain-containing protein [Bryobacteraceae bacterium]|nr:c-type cytochrome domain-containing protein [Bryobacteraceae bacterium]
MRSVFSLLLAVPLAAADYAQVSEIFAKRCAGCHSPAAKMGGFELHEHAAIMKGGAKGEAVKPGKAAESRLFQMLVGKVQPPMPFGQKPLPPAEIEAIREWIDGGALPGAPVASAAAPAIRPKGAVKPQVFSLAWRSDGKLLALGGYRTVRLLDAQGNGAGELNGHIDAVRAVAFSKDGTKVAAAGGVPGVKGEVKLWDAEARTVTVTITGHSDAIFAAAFSPDGKTLATASYDKLIKLWDASTGAEVRTLKDHIDAVYALAFTPDGQRLISGAADRTVKIWNPATGERLYTLGDPLDGINTVALHPGGKMVAAGGADKSIRIWSLDEKSGALRQSLMAHEDAILKLAWSPDGQWIYSSSADRTVKAFRASDLSEVKLIRQPDWTYGLEFSPDGARVAVGRFDGSVEFYPAR